MPTPPTPEQEARRQIDRMLEAAGWQVQARERFNRLAAPGIAVCEFPTTTDPVDYLLRTTNNRPSRLSCRLVESMELSR